MVVAFQYKLLSYFVSLLDCVSQQIATKTTERTSKPSFWTLFRYPPFDPFGNTQYIPLPPSNPHFALPVTNEDPYMNGRHKERFRRPLRNVEFNFRAFFDTATSPDEDEDNFVYESSPEFNEIGILSRLRKLHFRKWSNQLFQVRIYVAIIVYT